MHGENLKLINTEFMLQVLSEYKQFQAEFKSAFLFRRFVVLHIYLY
jgi:hypothetical protein